MKLCIYLQTNHTGIQTIGLSGPQLTRSSVIADGDAGETEIQGHSRSSVVVSIDVAYDFLLALNIVS